MPDSDRWVVAGLDNGGTSNNATLLDSAGKFLVGQLAESPSCVREGPARGVEALAESLTRVLELTGTDPALVRAVGLDTPGPSSADGVIAANGAANFVHQDWRGFDVRSALEARIGIPVVYNNDGNAAALYAHYLHYGQDEARGRSSVAAIIGTGLGGAVIDRGRVVTGATGMAGEFGHIWIPMQGLLAADQPVPVCNCGLAADAESVASLTGITQNLLPYWLTRYPGHQLSQEPAVRAAKMVRGLGEAGDPLALSIFAQQAMAIGRLFTMAASFTDPDVYFIGGGVVEAAPHFRDWFVEQVREHTALRQEQAAVASIALVPDLDMAGARGSAIAALETVRGQ
jgi:glucokinase